MSYTKTTWSDGDIITANKMNNIETGVESLNTDVGQLQTDLNSLTETVENLPTGGGDVPADYQELVDDVSDIKADLSDITGNAVIDTWSANKTYIKTDGTSANINSPKTTSTNVRYIVIPCEKGDQYTITASGGNASRAYAFINNNDSGKILERADANATLTEVLVTAPANTTHLIVNDTSLVGKVYSGKLLKNKYSEINYIFNRFLDESLEEKNISVMDYTVHSRIINSSNKWETIGRASVLIPIKNVYKIAVQSSDSNSTVIAFLKSAVLTAGTTPDFSDKYSSRILLDSTATEPTEFIVPSDALYLYARYTSGQRPKLLKFYSVKSSEQVIKKIREEIYNAFPTASNDLGRDIPENVGVLNAYKKAHQLLDVPWTAINPIPTRTGDDSITAGSSHTGVMYSSVKEHCKFVGLFVSLKTFMTALHNPYSLIYTENVSEGNSASDYGFTYHGSNCASYYGIVCSAFDEFPLGLDVYYDTDAYEYLHRIGVLEKPYDQSGTGLKLMDLYWKDGHTRLITDIYRDSRGTPTRIFMSETVRVHPVTQEYTLEQFNNKLASENGIIYRYTDLYKNIHYTPSEFVAVEDEPTPTYVYNDDICTFAGDYAAFHLDDTIYLNYTLGSYNAIQLYKDDELIQTYSVSDQNEHKIDISNECTGYGSYKARLTDGSNNSDYTYFMVVDTTVSVTNNDDILTVNFTSNNGEPMYLQICTLNGTSSMYYVFTEEEKAKGVAVIDAHRIRNEQYGTDSFSDNNGRYLRVFFKSDYGVVTNALIDSELSY